MGILPVLAIFALLSTERHNPISRGAGGVPFQVAALSFSKRIRQNVMQVSHLVVKPQLKM